MTAHCDLVAARGELADACGDLIRRLDALDDDGIRAQIKAVSMATAVLRGVCRVVTYRKYLQTDEWKQRAEAAKACAGYRCQVCNQEGSLDAHHRTYERLGCELPEDITVLCRSCHQLFSDKMGDGLKGQP
ncbi:MAG TPA: hypothetical protein VM238_04770 [Phycisphaerae bacterium]|nr:hypothetical protein [Phycisphaerae bacterium]